MPDVQKRGVFNISLWARIIRALKFMTAYDARPYLVLRRSKLSVNQIFTYTRNNDYNQRAYDIILNLSSL